jgi:hypothetical protein
MFARLRRHARAIVAHLNQDVTTIAPGLNLNFAALLAAALSFNRIDSVAL